MNSTVQNLTDHQLVSAVVALEALGDTPSQMRLLEECDPATLRVAAAGLAAWYVNRIVRQREADGLSRAEALAELVTEYQGRALRLADELAGR